MLLLVMVGKVSRRCLRWAALSQMVLRSGLDQFAVLDLDVDAAAASGNRPHHALQRYGQIALANTAGCSADTLLTPSRSYVH